MEYRLYVPEDNDPLEATTETLLVELSAAGLESQLQVSYQTPAENAADVSEFFDLLDAPSQPYLEVSVGGEMACVLHYRGRELEEELRALLPR